MHKGEKPFKCRLCDKAFTSTMLRNQHMFVHWGHKKFICDVCGKGFMSRKHFHDHLRIHNGEQQYRCEVCGKEFIYYRLVLQDLLKHNQFGFGFDDIICSKGAYCLGVHLLYFISYRSLYSCFISYRSLYSE